MLRYTTKRTVYGLEVRFLRLFEGLRFVKRRVHFRADGICIVTGVIGIQTGRKWFDRSQIYGFGYAVSGHGHARALQFNCAGEGQIVLANYVQEAEVAAFLQDLHQEGLDYNASWEMPRHTHVPLFTRATL
jgi:hypothetical protein